MKPESTFGVKYNQSYSTYTKALPRASTQEKKQVTRPIVFSHMQSNSYWKPTIVTRDYQREMPPNLIEAACHESQK